MNSSASQMQMVSFYQSNAVDVLLPHSENPVELLIIFGIGVDIAYIPRFRRTFERYGERFLKRAYHPNEIREFQNKSARSRVLFLASRWAVKEAVFKAFQHHRISFPEIVVVSSSKDKHQCAPQLKFCGNLRSLAQSLNIVEPKISISHDQEYAIAYVILQQQSKAG